MEHHGCYFLRVGRQRTRIWYTVSVAYLSFQFNFQFPLNFFRIDPDDLVQSNINEYDDYDAEENHSENYSPNRILPTQLRYYRRFMKKDDRPKWVRQKVVFLWI